MPGPQMHERRTPAAGRLAWQSRAILLMVCPAAAIYAYLQVTEFASVRTAAAAAGISILFAALVLSARAATPQAALLGALLAFCYALTPSALHSPLWPLAATLVLTLGASRIGAQRKLAREAPDAHHGRTASQVASNLGVGAVAGSLFNSEGMLLAHLAMTASLAELAADTLASELGPLAAGQPRMLLTGRRVPPGTDGAVSLPGTLAGICGAAIVCLVTRWALLVPWPAVALAWGAAIFGLFFDSLLGQLLERRGWLNNDAVNFLSTLTAALLALRCGLLL